MGAARMMERTVNERPNIHDMPFSERFKGDGWSAMSDRETCPISMIDAQLIAEGNDPFMTLEEEAKDNTDKALQAATKEAVELVTKAEKAETKSWELRKAAGLKLVELRQKVRDAGLSFDAWFKANITGISRATAYRYMAMVDEPELDPTEPWGMRHDNRYGVSGETGNAGHNGPEVEDKPQAKPRSANAERQARHRGRKAEAKRTADKYIEDPAPASTGPDLKDALIEHLRTMVEEANAARALAENELQNEKGHVKWLEEELELQTRAFKPHKSATPFTKAELRQLALAFHPDANLSVEKRTELFKLWNSKVGR
jgi:hypothetical protein